MLTPSLFSTTIVEHNWNLIHLVNVSPNLIKIFHNSIQKVCYQREKGDSVSHNDTKHHKTILKIISYHLKVHMVEEVRKILDLVVAYILNYHSFYLKRCKELRSLRNSGLRTIKANGPGVSYTNALFDLQMVPIHTHLQKLKHPSRKNPKKNNNNTKWTFHPFLGR